MTVESLRRLVQKHNAIQSLVGVLALVGTPLAWWFSFWLIRKMFWLATSWFLEGRTAEVTYWIAMGGMVVLAIEGLRRGWELFTLEDVASRPRIGLFVPIGPAYYGNIHATSYIYTQMLFFAPQITLAGIAAFRTLARPGPLTVKLAASIYNDLEERREWMPADGYAGAELAIALLERLGLIWTREVNDLKQLRIPPADSSAS